MIGSGKTVSQIAGDLALSVKTVSTYRVRVLEKMGMASNAELTRYAIKNQLVEVSDRRPARGGKARSRWTIGAFNRELSNRNGGTPPRLRFNALTS